LNTARAQEVAPVDLWQALGIGLALAMVTEGVLPFLSPARWREMMLMASRMSDGSLRALGLGSMMCGILLLYWIH
jgi:uncharacterized protein YjeT (DUF2065 family)